jgi:type IV pilus assembly protein PilW
MKRECKTRCPAHAQRGFSIVELMVATAIGLVLLAGVTHIFASSKATYRIQEGLSRVQENGRFALELMGRKIRMAGYQGCANLRFLTPSNIISTPPPEGVFDLNAVVNGVDNVVAGNAYGSTGARPGTDVLIVRGASSAAAQLTGNLTSDNANIQLDINSESYTNGDYLFITDCETADIFEASSVSTASGKITIAHANNVNTTNRLSKAYLDDAFLLKFETSTLYIMDSGRTNQRGTSIYSLYETDIYGNEREFISGVDDMQITYGFDTSPSLDGTVDEYRDAASIAASDWGKVLSVRLALLLSTDEDVARLPIAYNLLDGTVVANPPDRRLRRRFYSTITIRNRVL